MFFAKKFIEEGYAWSVNNRLPVAKGWRGHYMCGKEDCDGNTTLTTTYDGMGEAILNVSFVDTNFIIIINFIIMFLLYFFHLID